MKFKLQPIGDDARIDNITTEPPLTYTLENLIETIREIAADNAEWSFILRFEPEEVE